MNKDTELTVKESLSKMYDQGIDHAIKIIEEEIKKVEFEHYYSARNLMGRAIIVKLRNLKSK